VTLAIPDPGTHRMVDPAIRRRVAAMLAALFALALAIVSLLGRPSGPFTAEELRSVSGLPFAPPQIERRIAPAVNDNADLDQKIQELQDLLRGSPPAQPSPAATR